MKTQIQAQIRQADSLAKLGAQGGRGGCDDGCYAGLDEAGVQELAAIRANPRKFQGQAYRLMSDGGDTDDAKTEK